MKKSIIGVAIFLLHMSISNATSLDMTVADMEAESVEGLEASSEEMQEVAKYNVQDITSGSGC